jgi:LCP family protein required for cell wall assembly
VTTVDPRPPASEEEPLTAPAPPGGPPPAGPGRPARFYRMPRKRRRWLTFAVWTVWGLIGVVVGLAFALVTFVDSSISAASPDTPEFRAAVAATDPVLPGQPINILLIGSDKRPGKSDNGDPGRSDSIILVKMDPDRDFISMLSFPRDLYVPIPGYGSDKINAAYSIGGPKLTMETVKQLTGEPINQFVNIDFQGFVRLVNAVGGVYIDVDRRYFNDNSGGGPSYATIDLQPGYQKLNGDDALDYARFRHTDSDFQRINRQQQFLSELKRQTKRIGNLLQLPSFGKIFRDNIRMSITSRSQLLQILQLALTVDKSRIARVRINGGLDILPNGASIVRATQTEVADAVDKWKNPDFIAGPKQKRVVPSQVHVAVLNGNGRVLSADTGAQLLDDKGWLARPAGNATTFDYTESQVLYGPGKRDEGRAVQRLFGPFTGLQQAKGSLGAGVDVQVVLGSNFDGKLVPPPPPPPPVKASTVTTDALVPVMRSAQRSVHGAIKTEAPLRVPPGSRLRRVRLYRINTSGTGPWALKLVFEIGHTFKYWSITETEWTKNIPILAGETGVLKRGKRRFLTFYDGRNLMRVGWQENGMSYWVSNTLDNDLNSETMNAIARSFEPLAKAKLPKGSSNAPMEIEFDAPTP